jgi:hypothetical protein
MNIVNVDQYILLFSPLNDNFDLLVELVLLLSRESDYRRVLD